MKSRQPIFRLIRKGGRKKSRVRIGWRVLAIYIATLMAVGALATVLDLRIEYQEKIHAGGGKSGIAGQAEKGP